MLKEEEVDQASWTSYDCVQTEDQEKIFNEKPNCTVKKKKYISNLNAKVFVPPPPQDLSNEATFPDSTKFSSCGLLYDTKARGTLKCFRAH